MLCEAMTSSDLAGKPNEYFFHDNGQLSYQNWDIADYADYIKRVMAATSTPNGVFGAKILGGHLKAFLRQLWSVTGGPDEKLTLKPRFHSIFPQSKFVWITRRNKIRQAIALYWAIQTGQWVWTDESSSQAIPAPDYHFESIDHLLQEIIVREAILGEFMGELGAKPFVVVYEDNIETIEDTASSILKFLEIEIPKGHAFRERKMRVPNIPLLEDWVHQFREEKQRDWTTKYW
jgi:LPS sulfotransferase NodH